MLNRIIQFSIQQKLIVGLFAIGLIILGVFELQRLPIDAVPDITNNQVQIITVAPSYGATDIERLITFPIEQANRNIQGISEIRSFSRFGLSLVTIVFEDATDIYWARQQVFERLEKIKMEIPQGIGTPELGPITTGLGEIYQYVVKPKKGYEAQFDAMKLRTIQDWIVRKHLLSVEGVAEVSSFGGKLKQYEISVIPEKLYAHSLSIQDIFSALEKNNQNTGGAYIEKGNSVLFIRTEGLVQSAEDLEKIQIRNTASGIPILLRDVAKVRFGYSTRYGALCYNDQGEVSGAVVMMLKGENSSKVIENIKKKVSEIQKILPEGVEIEPFLDRTKMVNNAIHTVQTNLMEGALIVVFVLVLFLGNWRAGLIVASVIPLSMLFAVIMMNQFGVSGNLMSLGALDFGLIIDGAVIIVEAVLHKLHNHKNFTHEKFLTQEKMDTEVQTAAQHMMNSAVFGQIIILIVYLPILSLSGIEGKMFKPMAQTVAFALIGAFLLSLTYVPMMTSLFLSKKLHQNPSFSDKMMQKIESIYRKMLKFTLRKPVALLSFAFGLFAISLGIFFQMGGEFIPTLEEGDFAVETRVLTGSNLNTAIEYTQKASALLLKNYPEIEKIVTKIGSGEVPNDPMPMEAADMMVILKDKSDWKNANSFNELAEKMSKTLEQIPGITTGFQYPVQMRFNELMTGARQDIVCKIFGENLDSLVAFSEKLHRIAQKVKGTTDHYVEPILGMPQIVIRYQRNALARYHLSVDDVNKIVNASFAGQTAGFVYEGEKRFDLIVKIASEHRNVQDLENLLIPIGGGNQIPLRQLADIQIINGPNQIQRENAARRVVVGFNVRGRDIQSVIEDIQKRVKNELHLPKDYQIHYGGTFENLNEAKSRLMIAVPISLALIFVLLYFAFHSIQQGILVFTAIPLSATGGIFFLYLREMPFSISAGIGFIALFGIAVLNGIVLISEFNRLYRLHSQPIRIVLEGTASRLRPVLMTAFVASLGFFPMAFSQGSGAEVQRPLATVVIGGLAIATILTLFVLPILYFLFFIKKSKS